MTRENYINLSAILIFVCLFQAAILGSLFLNDSTDYWKLQVSDLEQTIERLEDENADIKHCLKDAKFDVGLALNSIGEFRAGAGQKYLTRVEETLQGMCVMDGI